MVCLCESKLPRRLMVHATRSNDVKKNTGISTPMHLEPIDTLSTGKTSDKKYSPKTRFERFERFVRFELIQTSSRKLETSLANACGPFFAVSKPYFRTRFSGFFREWIFPTRFSGFLRVSDPTALDVHANSNFSPLF